MARMGFGLRVWQMPCKAWMAGKHCNRGHKCTYAHTHTSLTRLLAHLNNARRYLDICVYCFTCNEIADAVRPAPPACPSIIQPAPASIHHTPVAQNQPTPPRGLWDLCERGEPCTGWSRGCQQCTPLHVGVSQRPARATRRLPLGLSVHLRGKP